MHESTNKYKRSVSFVKAKLVCYPFATKYYLIVFTLSKFTLIYFKWPAKLIWKANTWKIYPKTAKIYMIATRDACDI